MLHINVRLCEIESRVVPIGFEGEQNHTQVIFDASSVFASNPTAVPSLTVEPDNGDAYPKQVQKSGDKVTWDVSASDCASGGFGRYQLTFTDGNEIIKTCIGKYIVFDSIIGNGTPPDPLADWIAEAQAELSALENLSASASGLPYGSEATAEMTETEGHKNIAFGIPAGAPGTPGQDGNDGVSPVVSVTEITGGHRVSITDATGTETFDVMDGQSGTGAVTDVQINGTSILSSGVANIPLSSANDFGVVKIANSWGTGVINGQLYIISADDTNIKSGSNAFKPIVPTTQHKATFYGLAKASGDTTQKDSNNSVGTYTESAKSAIASMLNAPETVSGSTPTINAKAGVRYVCGECATLTIVVPASGIIDVTFDSGSTATVLTVTPPTGVTIKWANGFDPTSLDANTTYEINIMDGLGVACSWT